MGLEEGRAGARREGIALAGGAGRSRLHMTVSSTFDQKA